MGVMQFKVDAGGAFLNNGVLCIQTDTQDKGKLMIDPRYGIAAGTQALYTIGEDGTTLIPSFIRSDGKVELDSDNMPENANFFLDIRTGKAYFRGNIYAENGYFNGEVHATSGEFSGTLKATTLDGKLIGSANASVDLSDVDYIDLGGMILDGRDGSTGIRFRPGYEPVKYQFATAATGPWHDAMGTNDKYRRDSLDGGTTWGDPYQFRGADGKNGSDANVTFANIKAALQKAASTQKTFITADEMGAPNIYGGNIYGAKMYANDYYIYPQNETDYDGSFNIYGMYIGTGKQYHMLQIRYDGTVTAPRVYLNSPDGAYLHIGQMYGGIVYLDGGISFQDATILDWGNNRPTAVFA